MGRIQQFSTWVASKLVPQLPAALEAAASLPEVRRERNEAAHELTQTKEALGRSNASIELMRQMERGWYKTNSGQMRRTSPDVNEFFEAGLMASGGPGAAQPDPERTVAMKERFWELELALEDRGWQRQVALSAFEFSRYGIGQLMLICRLYAIRMPLIKRGIDLVKYYVFGRGMEISVPDNEAANTVVQDFMDRNQKELGPLGLAEKEGSLQTDGNLFVLFAKDADGQQIVKTIDACEIIEILTNPDDSDVPWYYLRQFQKRTFDAKNGTNAESKSENVWYPAINFTPKDETIRGYNVMKETPVYHIKVGGMPKWLFGCPEVYAALDSVRMYDKFLKNWATITDALARFTWNYETTGGNAAIQALQQAFSTTLGNGDAMVETNPPPIPASTHVSGPGNKLTPIRTSGATTDPEQGRRVALLACSAMGFAETMLLGDASTGSLATATSLDRPTELKMLMRQEQWRQWLQTILIFVLGESLGEVGSAFRESFTEVQLAKVRIVPMVPRLRVVSGRLTRIYEADAKKQSTDAANKAAGKITIAVKFPSVLEHNIKDMIEGIVAATTLNGFEPANTIDIKTVAGLLLAELGVEDPDKILEAMYPAADYDPEVVEEEPVDAGAPGQNGIPNQANPNQQQNNQQKREAHLINELLKVSRKLQELSAR